MNNDTQQMIKYEQIIMAQDERMKVINALKYVDRTVLSIDTDGGQCETLEMLTKDERYSGDKFVWAKSGDRTIDNIPEVETCGRCGIEMVFDVGAPKSNSSSEINRRLGRMQDKPKPKSK